MEDAIVIQTVADDRPDGSVQHIGIVLHEVLAAMASRLSGEGSETTENASICQVGAERQHTLRRRRIGSLHGSGRANS